MRILANDMAFTAFINRNPEEMDNLCAECDGTGLVRCPECGELPPWERTDDCDECEGRLEVSCEACNTSGLAAWSWWNNRHAIELIGLAYWNCLCAGINNNSPIPGQIYRI